MKRTERTPEAIEFGTRLRRFLDAAGISPKELAHRIGRSPSYIRSMLVGIKGPPGRETLERIADVLGISIDALLGEVPEDETVRLLMLRRNLAELGREMDPRLRDLIKVYTFRDQVGRADIPEPLRREVLRDANAVIRELEQQLGLGNSHLKGV